MEPITNVLVASQIATLQILSTMTDLLLQTHQDVSGLKESLKEMDPTFTDVFEMNQKKANTESRVLPLVAQINGQVGALLSSLQDMQKLMS